MALNGSWPSPRARGYVQMLAQYHPDLHARWRERLERALDQKRLDKRTEEVLVAGVVAVLHFAPEVVEQHLDAALDAGSNVAELLEAMIRIGEQEGQHALSSGGEALWTVVHRREAAGAPTPRTGPPLTAADLVPHSPWLPVRFPYHTPHPRYWQQAIPLYDPERAAINKRAAEERAKLAPQLSRRMVELLDAAVDVVVRWKAPRIDHHMHEAFHAGSNVQEMLEVFFVCAVEAQGARESNISGRQVEGGLEILIYGLSALDRVIAERQAVGERTDPDHP